MEMVAREFKFPDVGEGITEGEIVEWLVEEGDYVNQDQAIVKIETDKAVVDIPSPYSGRILKLHFRKGDTVKVGATLVTIADRGGADSAKTGSVGGVIEQPRRSVGVVGELEEAQEEPQDEEGEAAKIQPSALGGRVVKDESKVVAAPATRKLAKELGVDITKIVGKGVDGRVTDDDVRRSAGAAGSSTESTIKEGEAKIKVEKKYDFYGFIERVPLRGIRKSVAGHMSEAVHTAAHVTHFDEADVSELVRLREKEKIAAENRGIKLTYLPFIIKAVVAALREHPYMNSSLDDEHEEIILKKYYNIGIAVDTGEGLIVPVIKEASEKSILELAKEISGISEKAKNRSVDLADLKGGTFTITNVGVIGGRFATPIINYPEVAILALGKIDDRAVVEKGRVAVKKTLPLSLSFDHRVVDGAEAARFVNDIKKRLEDPDLLLIEK